MNVLLLGIDLYLAAVLGVSGLAKVEHPQAFAATLRRHRVLPAESIPAVSRAIPWLEIGLATALVGGAFPIATTALAFALFVSFLLIEIVLVVTRRATDCGCYGVAYPQKVDRASLGVSGILIVLAAVGLWAASRIGPLGLEWRVPGIMGFAAAGFWAVWKMVRRRRAGTCAACQAKRAVRPQAGRLGT